MHPFHHALSSARARGGAPDDYLALHSWFDRSKMALALFKHRALRHHAEGIACAEAAFGPELATSAGARVPVAELGLQHLDEDCRRAPSAGDWLRRLEAPGWMPASVPSPEDAAAAISRGPGADPADALPVCAWMLATSAWFGDARHLAMRHHAFGIFEAEEALGATLPTAAGGRVPTRYLAERHVRHVLGRIPPASDWLRRIEGEPWMADARRPEAVLGAGADGST